jgi:phosphoribosylcarboxyaminoimidazole (NCAIR) mutase
VAKDSCLWSSGRRFESYRGYHPYLFFSFDILAGDFVSVKIILHYASESDIPHVIAVEDAIEKILGDPPSAFGIYVKRRCGSAHKTPDYLLNITKETRTRYSGNCKESCDIRGVILGRQPAASAFIDANSAEPVVTYLTDGKDNPGKIYSSLDVPSGVACVTAPPWPEAMALALLKMATLKEDFKHKIIRDRILRYQQENRNAVQETDKRYAGKKLAEVKKIFEERKKK